jgi:hypothetical protein
MADMTPINVVAPAQPVRGRPVKYATEEERRNAQVASTRISQRKNYHKLTSTQLERRRLHAHISYYNKMLAERTTQNPKSSTRHGTLTPDQLRDLIAEYETRLHALPNENTDPST